MHKFFAYYICVKKYKKNCLKKCVNFNAKNIFVKKYQKNCVKKCINFVLKIFVLINTKKLC